MRIGLINIEPKIYNTAYMQIAEFHKICGDQVGWWSPITDRLFDHLYCSGIFTFTDKSEVPERAICGGTGFDVISRLSVAMEKCGLDYSIYPNCDRSFVWFSRGCIRNCPWCIVPQKEGRISPVSPNNLNPKGRYIVVQDNNFFANPLWPEAIKQLMDWDQPVDFQGVDVRLLNKEQIEALCRLRHYKQIKIAWDDPEDDETRDSIYRLCLSMLPKYKIMCYVLIGFNSTESQDLYRVTLLRDWGIDPFVMAYDKNDLYQRSFARWVNHKAIFKKVAWEDYKQRVLAQKSIGNGWLFE